MNVICVQPIDSTAPGLEDAPRPAVGDPGTVTKQFIKGPFIYYGLVGYAHVYRADCFAILPSESEEVAAEHQHEAIIYAR